MHKNFKKLFLAVVPIYLAVMLMAVIYGYKEYNGKVVVVSGVKEVNNVGARVIVDEFLQDEYTANAQHMGKIVSVAAPIRSWENDGVDKSGVIVQRDENNREAACCCMSSGQCVSKAECCSVGCEKGVCIGLNRDSLPGSDPLISKCVMDNE